MGTKLAVLGAFMIVSGSFGIALSFATDAAFLQPTAPSVLVLVAGVPLLIVGLLLP